MSCSEGDAVSQLTDEARQLHIGNAECGIRTLLRQSADDLEAINAHFDRWTFDAETMESTTEALDLAVQLLAPIRECLDLHVRSYAAASLDKLKAEGYVPDCYDE